MLIRVKYPDGTYDMVKEQTLDSLLAQGKLAGFKRSEGWAVVGRDPIRHPSRQSEWQHNLLERRGIPQSSRTYM